MEDEEFSSYHFFFPMRFKIVDLIPMAKYGQKTKRWRKKSKKLVGQPTSSPTDQLRDRFNFLIHFH